jgi:hypothetical protein
MIGIRGTKKIVGRFEGRNACHSAKEIKESLKYNVVLPNNSKTFRKLVGL